MQLLGQAVKHISFGKGVIQDISGKYITVCFAQGEKKFLYPDAFSRFLTMKDEKKQKVLDEKNNRRMALEQNEKQKEQDLQKFRQKVRTMKVIPNSQAVFHVDLANAKDLVEIGMVSTGCYLSGQYKGTPRPPRKLNPNSVCLITGVQKGDEERDRCIVGAFAVKEDFVGECCRDGIVKGHNKYKVFLDTENALPFWEYFEHDGTFPNWGNVPFKYFSNTVMQKILYDMKKLSAGTKEETVVNEFYDYYCGMNHL